MTKKELELIQKLNSNPAIELCKEVYRNLPLKQMTEIYNNYYEQIRAVQKIIKSSQVVQVNKILTPEVLKVLEESRKIISNLENNPVFKEIWSVQQNFSFENQEIFESEIKKFKDDINEFTAQIPENILEENFPVEEVLEEFNKVAEEPITEKTLKNAIGFVCASSYSDNEDISFSARKILADLGNFSKSDEGAGLAVIFAIISFLSKIIFY